MVGRDRKKIRGGGRRQHKQGQREGRGRACITQDLFCFVLAWETGSHSVVEVDLNSIYSPGWPWTHNSPLAFSSWVIGWEAQAITPIRKTYLRGGWVIRIDELSLLHRGYWLSEVGQASLPALTQVDTKACVVLSVVLGSSWSWWMQMAVSSKADRSSNICLNG